ncbi:hypothetical protein K438DRAFT_1765970 [Mycena galopus ATCC 62051]|nr:hypothetical protein K438DRAFT_1765970 [Mycena galopus ATCC 62051]
MYSSSLYNSGSGTEGLRPKLSSAWAWSAMMPHRCYPQGRKNVPAVAFPPLKRMKHTMPHMVMRKAYRPELCEYGSSLYPSRAMGRADGRKAVQYRSCAAGLSSMPSRRRTVARTAVGKLRANRENRHSLHQCILFFASFQLGGEAIVSLGGLSKLPACHQDYKYSKDIT